MNQPLHEKNKNGESIISHQSNDQSQENLNQWLIGISMFQKGLSVLEWANTIQNSLADTLGKLTSRVEVLEKNKKFEFSNPKEQKDFIPSYDQKAIINCLQEAQKFEKFIQNQLDQQQEIFTIVLKQSLDDDVEILEQYKDLTQYGYPFIQQYYYKSPITAATLSPNEKIIVICTQNTVFIQTAFAYILLNQIQLADQQTSIAFFQDSSKCILGSDSGEIIIVDTSADYGQIMNHFKAHQNKICQIISIKQDQQIVTLSIDNTIKIFQLNHFQNILTINTSINYFAGFDFSEEFQFIIGPNDQDLCLWDEFSGNCIMKLENIIQQESFIQIILSSNQDQALINLYDEKKILIVGINYSMKKLILKYQIETEIENLNVSWCLDDKAFLQLNDKYFYVRYIEDSKIPLIAQTRCFCDKPFLHKQNSQAINLLTITNKATYIYFLDQSLIDQQNLLFKK